MNDYSTQNCLRFYVDPFVCEMKKEIRSIDKFQRTEMDRAQRQRQRRHLKFYDSTFYFMFQMLPFLDFVYKHKCDESLLKGSTVLYVQVL